MNLLFRIFSFVLAVFYPIISFRMSFMPSECDYEFDIFKDELSRTQIMLCGEKTAYTLSGDGTFENGAITLNGKTTLAFDDVDCNWFNYYGIAYSADEYIKGELVYGKNKDVFSEEFFIEPAENGEFYSFIDGMLDKVKGNKIYSVSFEPLSNDSAAVRIYGISVFNRQVPAREVYIDNGSIKIGVDLLWGGALSYYEDLDSNVEAVKVDGKIKVDSNASARYGARTVNKNVNLINRYDPGRLVQQSYYGSDGSSGDGYTPGGYMDVTWRYNPVQGGNKFGESSKIVDLRVSKNELYVKCRPLDWSLPAENITPSYMEATYTLDGKLMHAECRFVDFSGYQPTYTTQEIPAFYCIEPFNRYVYYGGDNPWEGEALTVEPELIFWPDAGYPNFNSSEHWSAFVGEFDDSFGMGVYVPDETNFLAGIFDRGNTTEKDPSKDVTTSYIALIKYRLFQSYDPYSYEFYLTSGNTAEMRDTFSIIG